MGSNRNEKKVKEAKEAEERQEQEKARARQKAATERAIEQAEQARIGRKASCCGEIEG